MLEQIIQFLDLAKSIQWGANTAYDYFLAAAVFIGLFLLLKIFEWVIIARLRVLSKRTKTDIDDTVIEVLHDVKPPIYLLIALYFGIQFITLPEIVQNIVRIFFLVAIVYEVVQAISKLLAYVLHRFMNKNSNDDDNKQNQAMIKVITGAVKVFLWLLGLLLILQNLGVNVTSLIASLGIGGLAVALALQSVLSDLVSSVSIYMDKPFEVGDFITAGSDSGTVEKIGLKTTRLQTLRGEELVISNKELTSTRVQNFRKLTKRREAMTLGVLYETASEKLEQIPKIVEDIVNAQELAEFDRCHFSKLNDFSLDFDIVYYVATKEYGEYMDIKQAINLALFKAFAEKQIEFAYPTQKVYVEK